MNKRSFILSIQLITLVLLLTNSAPKLSRNQAIDLITSDHNFDVITWELNAIWVKMLARSLNLPAYLSNDQQVENIKKYFDSNKLTVPTQLDPDKYALVMESFVERQVENVINFNVLKKNGTFLPPVLFLTTPLPMNLIVSRRDVIQTEMSKVVEPIPYDQLNDFEANLDKNYDVSTIVEEIGGYSTYPTMVQRTANFGWQLETIAHEWVHIYLATTPLGLNYTTQKMRTANETVASIVGEEIGKMVFDTYYAVAAKNSAPDNIKPTANRSTFDYQLFMFDTRNEVDSLLLKGKIEQAEAYMEERRLILNQNGYDIRKLNQAFFAFHGSYSANPLSAAGSDPIGEAIRRFRAQSPNLQTFLKQISTISNDQELEKFLSTH